MVFGSVPRLWPGETVVCLASGPSLTREDVNACRGRAKVIAVKDCIRLAPWADALYGSGKDTFGRWWQTNGPSLQFNGLRFSLDPDAAAWSTVLQFDANDVTGLDDRPTHLRTGRNSGYAAINLAVHLGARRIVLLGYDLQEGPSGEQRWFGSHPWGTRSWGELGAYLREIFATLVEPARTRGIEIINATRRSALSCFPAMSIEDALSVGVCA